MPCTCWRQTTTVALHIADDGSDTLRIVLKTVGFRSKAPTDIWDVDAMGDTTVAQIVYLVQCTAVIR